jgi:serine/threonine-protein kinase SRPK3
MTMQDHFQLDGPNGTHDCLVLEILGPSAGDVLDKYFCNGRLPARLAKRIAKQTLVGLCALHDRGIVHGGKSCTMQFPCFLGLRFVDLYIRNVAFTVPSLQDLTEAELVRKLGTPETGPIRRKDGSSLDYGMPQYLVRPRSFPPDLKSSTNAIKIIDYGQSFLRHDTPDEFNTPLPVRAPEIIFKDAVDYRMDLWSMGCMVSPTQHPTTNSKLMATNSFSSSSSANHYSTVS